MRVEVKIIPDIGETVFDPRPFNLGWGDKGEDVLIAVFQKSTGNVGYVMSFTQTEMRADGENIGRRIAETIR